MEKLKKVPTFLKNSFANLKKSLTKIEKGDKRSNEFDNYKNNVYELIHKVNSKQQEREEKIEKFGRSNEDIIRLGIEIRDALQDIQIKLQEMDKVLSRQAKKPKANILEISFK